jgi:hypothetical protein
LYFYGARWYDSELGRFIQADTEIPGLGNTIAFDRYSYVLNNPIKYYDPNGHLATLPTALLGMVIGAGVDYALQVIENTQSGMSFSDAALNVDGYEIAAAAAGGFVFGLTLGAATAFLGTGYIATAMAGGAAGLLGGQADALTEAFLREAFSCDGFDSDQFLNNAVANGFFDPRDMLIDSVTGAITVTLGEAATKSISKIISKVFGPKFSPGNVPEIKFFKDQAYIEISGHPGLHIPQSRFEEFKLAIALGSWELIEEILEEAARQSVDPLEEDIPAKNAK